MTGPEPDGRRQGAGFGLLACACWAVYNTGTDLGRAWGFSSLDLMTLRFCVAALLFLPLLLPRSGQAPAAGRAQATGAPLRRWSWITGGLPLRRLVLLTVCIGPPFTLLINTGYGIAPLAHAVVISPGMTMLTANALSVFLDRRPMPLARMAGLLLVSGGLIAMALEQPASKTPGVAVWLGDLCFVGSGTLWGVFTYLSARWQLDPVRATGAVTLVSAVLVLPPFWLLLPHEVPPPAAWAWQVLFQGVLGGCLALLAYMRSVALLGPGLSAIFPAMVPPLAVLLAIPLTGAWPSVTQWSGIALASTGLVVSLDLISKRKLPVPRKGH
ncbi:EamA family transporter [Microvirga tunisiensis]|uniref:EamA family transporter n=1 Tax=Pannonibacter tanglangensis TaxID=2750084 RepID=A0A7X5F535_9HYPH|nr:EamA family transporter [Pannonibacter sp. XCT-53]